MNIISINNALLTRTLSMTLRVIAKVLLHVYRMVFMTRRYPLNNSDAIDIFFFFNFILNLYKNILIDNIYQYIYT